MNRARILLLIAVLAGGVAAVLGTRSSRENRSQAASDPQPFRVYRSEVLYTVVEIRLPDGEGVGEAAEAVFEACRSVDARMNEWKPSSPLSAVNAAAGREPVEVPGDLREVLRRAMAIGEMTGGAFDVTWAALWGLWSFDEEAAVPDSAAVAKRTALVDYRGVDVDDARGTVYLPEEGMQVGLGGIAKGYALDRAVEILRGRGFEDFLILAGGQVWAEGKQNGRPWRVGIRDPRGGPEDYFALLEVEDASLSSSGDYERFFLLGGVRYHHILDPVSGYPARGVRSATAIASDATLADALSTAFVVMGVDRSLALAERTPGVEAVLVDDEGAVHTSGGIGGRLILRHDPRP
jgi:thiamine biosynthesis lipoprotein